MYLCSSTRSWSSHQRIYPILNQWGVQERVQVYVQFVQLRAKSAHKHVCGHDHSLSFTGGSKWKKPQQHIYECKKCQVTQNMEFIRTVYTSIHAPFFCRTRPNTWVILRILVGMKAMAKKDSRYDACHIFIWLAFPNVEPQTCFLNWESTRL